MQHGMRQGLIPWNPKDLIRSGCGASSRNGASRLPGAGAHSSTYLAVCSVRYKLVDTQCDDVWLKCDGKSSF